MAHVNITGHQHGLYRVCQIEQSQQIAGCAARAAHGLRCGFVGEPELFNQPLQALRFLERIEVFALNVLYQRHGCRCLVGHIAHQHRNAVEAGQFGRSEAALTRNNFVFASVGAFR